MLEMCNLRLCSDITEGGGSDHEPRLWVVSKGWKKQEKTVTPRAFRKECSPSDDLILAQ
jgi:hypothetical protein